MNNTDSIASDYAGTKGQDYAVGRKQDSLNHLGYRLQAKLFLPHIPKDSTVLDFGCGNGSLARIMGESSAAIEGLEVNEFARELAISQGIRTYASLAEIPAGHKYDVIVSNHVLEHIPDVIGTLSKLKDLLRDGGKLVLVLPIDDFRNKENRQWREDDPNHHLHTWTPLLIGNALKESGFQVREARVITTAWSYKLFFLGEGLLQSIVGWMLSVLKKHRQLLAVASRD